MGKNNFKWVHADAEANCKLGEVSGELRYNRRNRRVTGSYNLTPRVNARAGACFFRAEEEFDNGRGQISASGPGVYGEIGLKVNHKRIGVDALAEASACKARASYRGLFLEGNLNATTGVMVGTDGVKFAGAGWGITGGTGGRVSFDTPFASFGFDI